VVPSSRERDEMPRVLILALFGSSGFPQTTPNVRKKNCSSSEVETIYLRLQVREDGERN